jgi:hypothetical protein
MYLCIRAEDTYHLSSENGAIRALLTSADTRIVSSSRRHDYSLHVLDAVPIVAVLAASSRPPPNRCEAPP